MANPMYYEEVVAGEWQYGVMLPSYYVYPNEGDLLCAYINFFELPSLWETDTLYVHVYIQGVVDVVEVDLATGLFEYQIPSGDVGEIGAVRIGLSHYAGGEGYIYGPYSFEILPCTPHNRLCDFDNDRVLFEGECVGEGDCDLAIVPLNVTPDEDGYIFRDGDYLKLLVEGEGDGAFNYDVGIGIYYKMLGYSGYHEVIFASSINAVDAGFVEGTVYENLHMDDVEEVVLAFGPNPTYGVGQTFGPWWAKIYIECGPGKNRLCDFFPGGLNHRKECEEGDSCYPVMQQMDIVADSEGRLFREGDTLSIKINEITPGLFGTETSLQIVGRDGNGDTVWTTFFEEVNGNAQSGDTIYAEIQEDVYAEDIEELWLVGGFIYSTWGTIDGPWVFDISIECEYSCPPEYEGETDPFTLEYRIEPIGDTPSTPLPVIDEDGCVSSSTEGSWQVFPTVVCGDARIEKPPLTFTVVSSCQLPATIEYHIDIEVGSIYDASVPILTLEPGHAYQEVYSIWVSGETLPTVNEGPTVVGLTLDGTGLAIGSQYNNPPYMTTGTVVGTAGDTGFFAMDVIYDDGCNVVVEVHWTLVDSEGVIDGPPDIEWDM